LIPGIQGRWAYTEPAVDALARQFRVLTFDLADGFRTIDDYVAQVEQVLDRCGVTQAIVCGVSFGGMIALRFAARFPDRTAALILVSTPGPGFRLKPRHQIYARWPWIFGPIFLAEMPRRVGAELKMAIPTASDRFWFAVRQARTFMRAPVSLPSMAARAQMVGASDVLADCAAVHAPTLVVHGEASLDHVVGADGSSQYARLIPGASGVTLESTGHLGFVTRPKRFAAIVCEFGERHRLIPAARRGRPDAA
jgi:pimeloyl-ACP methyl ester carboxylesterase